MEDSTQFEGPSVRRIEQPEPEPIDLLDVAGGAVVSRVARVAIPVAALAVLLALLLAIRRR